MEVRCVMVLQLAVFSIPIRRKTEEELIMFQPMNAFIRIMFVHRQEPVLMVQVLPFMEEQ